MGNASEQRDESEQEPTPATGERTETTEQQPEAPEQPEGQTGAPEGADDLTDRHGQPAIARGKYERDMAAKDKEIAELKSKVEEMSKTEDGRKQMQEQIDKLQAEIASDKVNHALELAGCVNVKAARAVLDDYDGDVTRLRKECPYLFKEAKQAGSTGLPTGGAPNTADEQRRKAYESVGRKPPKKG